MSTGIIIDKDNELRPSKLKIRRGQRFFFENRSGEHVRIKLPADLVDDSAPIDLGNNISSGNFTVRESATSGDHIFTINNRADAAQGGRGGGTGKIHVND